MTNAVQPIDNNTSLVDLLSNQNILSSTDMNALADSKQFIIDTYLTVPMYRPLVIKLFGVLNNAEFPTPDSKLWQCKVEAEVHADELIRDLHDKELQKNQIGRAENLIKKIASIYEDEQDEEKKIDISFDLREQQILLSRKKFELSKLEKKIKYRIEEVHEWKQIAEKVAASPDFKNQNHAMMLTEALVGKWSNKLLDTKITELEKRNIQNQISALQQISSANQKVIEELKPN